MDARVANAAGVSCVILGKHRASDASAEAAADAGASAATVRNYDELHAMLFPTESELTS